MLSFFNFLFLSFLGNQTAVQISENCFWNTLEHVVKRFSFFRIRDDSWKQPPYRRFWENGHVFASFYFYFHPFLEQKRFSFLLPNGRLTVGELVILVCIFLTIFVLQVYWVLMCLLGIAVIVATTRYTYVGLMSMGRQQRQRPWKRIAPLNRFVTSNILHQNIKFFFFAKFFGELCSVSIFVLRTLEILNYKIGVSKTW